MIKVDMPELCRAIIQHIVHKISDIFPVIAEKRQIHPHEFDIMLEQIRAIVFHYRLVKVDYNAYSFIWKRPLLRSQFLSKGEYIILDGTFILASMRNYVRLYKQQYRQIHQIQKRYQDEEINVNEINQELGRVIKEWTTKPPLLSPEQPI